MQVPSRHAEDDYLPSDDGNRSCNTERSVGRRTSGLDFPDTSDGETGLHVAEDSLQDENARQDAKEHVDQHEDLAYPAEYPVALEVVDEREEGGEVGCCGEEREEPDDEEVVWYHCLHFREADGLDADTG